MTANQRVTALTVELGAPGSAADKAGLTGVRIGAEGLIGGDVITAVEGKAVNSTPALLARLDDFRVGDTVRLTVRRGGRHPRSRSHAATWGMTTRR
ncbi:MAG: PDZ domain-containing protein [Rehaibacterium terrae]|uniref:PDZ domain-containing protein n=1 Tax=Rehaibacterium terrae TaxID=1341696 RepID=UPI00391C3964